MVLYKSIMMMKTTTIFWAVMIALKSSSVLIKSLQNRRLRKLYTIYTAYIKGARKISKIAIQTSTIESKALISSPPLVFHNVEIVFKAIMVAKVVATVCFDIVSAEVHRRATVGARVQLAVIFIYPTIYVVSIYGVVP